MDVGTPLVADRQATEAVEPGERAFHDPAVPAQPFAGFHATSGDPRPDGAGATLFAATPVIIGLVGVELLGPPARSPSPVPHARHRVEGGRQHEAVVPVGWAQAHPERGASPVDHKVALCARFAPIRRVRAGLGAPLFAAADALSREARLQSSCPASASRSRSTR